MSSIFKESHSYDSVSVVGREQSGQEIKYKNFDNLQQALQQFIQFRPSDEQLLHESDYILLRKVTIQKNLKAEINKIENLIPGSPGNIDYSNFKQKTGKKLIQHFKRLFDFGGKNEKPPEFYLTPFLLFYKAYLQQMYSNLMEDSNVKFRVTSSIVSESTLNDLRSRPRSARVTQSATDEKMILEEKRKEILVLEENVLKIVIAIERINYYTMGIILPRDQLLNVIPFFESVKDPLYDIQSCLKIQSLIKHQIERLEQIERQISPNNTSQIMRSTITIQKPTAFFGRTPEDLKKKHEFRENFFSQESSQRCMDIWHEFSDDKTFGLLSQLKVNLHVQILSLSQKVAELGYKLTLHLLIQPSKPQCQQVQIDNSKNSWLFTEIRYAESILQHDLVMIIKVFKEIDVNVKNKQKLNPKSQNPMKLSFLKAYSIINVSDQFFEEKMKDGKSLDPIEIRFFNFDNKYILEQDYERILKDLRDNEFSGQLDDELSSNLNLKMKLTFISCINRYQLSLRLDKSMIIRQRFFWEKMAKDKDPKEVNLQATDPQYIYQREMEQLNLKELQKPDTLNELRININQIKFDEKKQSNHQLSRVQVFLVYNDQTNRSSVNLKFLEQIYQGATTSKKFEESHQTQISTLKKNIANFRSEFFLRAPITLKARDLQNYKLVFMVYVAVDQKKENNKFTEQQLENDQINKEPRYIFYPYYFCKLPLLDKNTNLILGSNIKEQHVQLMKYNPAKYLQEQLEVDGEILQGTTISINISLTSQQYSTNVQLNKIIEPLNEIPLTEITTTVENLSNNDLLIYHTRIMYSLLHLYNNTQLERSKDAFQAIIVIFKRFHSQEMSPYRQLVQDYSERWKGDRESDKKLLERLIIMLQKVPESIIETFEKQIDLNVNHEIEDIQQRLTHMPALLSLICRLFSREFQQQYASIREKINTHFRRYMEKELCIYRPDLVESPNDHKISMSSKPAKIVQLLVENVDNLNRKIKKQSQVIVEDDEEDSDGIDKVLSSNEEQFGQRISQYQIRRSTLKTDLNLNSQGDNVQLNQLIKLVNEIKLFQNEFCRDLKNVLLSIARYLHEDVEMTRTDPEFCNKVNKIIDIQRIPNLSASQLQELNQLIENINEPFNFYIEKFSEKARFRLQAQMDRRQELRSIFWKTLQSNLNATLNFIDRGFVLNLFDEKLILHKIEPMLDKVMETIIPKFDICTKTFGPFYKAQLEFTSKSVTSDVEKAQIRQNFESKVKLATTTQKSLRDQEEKEIEKQVQTKVIVLSEFISSDCFILLPSEVQPQHLNQPQQVQETTQQILATKISLSVYNLLKQYKSQFKEIQDSKSNQVDKVKDTTSSELQFLFLYRMAAFEKNYYTSLNNQVQDYEERPTNGISFLMDEGAIQQNPQTSTTYSRVQSTPYQPISEFDEFESDLLTGLARQQPQIQTNLVETNQVTEESKDIQVSSSVQSLQLKQKNDQIQQIDGKVNQIQDSMTNNLNTTQKKLSKRSPLNPLGESMKLGLGARKELNLKDRQDLLPLMFESGVERRLCFFLNEMEDALSKYWELKENSQNLSVQEMAKMKAQYISLFSVLSLQHLSNLTSNSFKLLYSKRPGCLDRLVKQVRLTTNGLEFSVDEFFFNIKKLQVVEKFCKNVIDMLCEPSNKKYIADLSDKYTYKSIISQVWILQLTLLAEQAQALYEFVGMGYIMKNVDLSFKENVNSFQARLQKHLATQQYLWSNYKDMDDMILPDEGIDYYGSIQGRVVKILQVDLEDITIEVIDKFKLQSVLRPLAQMFMQLDELTFKTQGVLSYRVFTYIERLLKEFVDYTGQMNKDDAKKNNQIQRAKKKQICEEFCEEYIIATSIELKDAKLRQELRQRVQEVIMIKSMYLNVIEYEKQTHQEGNLLAQLISYYGLMQLLQEKNLSVSFQNNIKTKYKTMVENINSALLRAYQADLKLAEQDPDHICQMQPSQYLDQMKEVRAFMHVEDYETYKSALEKGLLESLGNKHNVRTLENIIDLAVELLVPQSGQSKSKENPPNQFFDISLKLLSEKRALQEMNYDFKSVIRTLGDQTSQYQMYESFERKQVYCTYYRIKIEAFLPEKMQVQDRLFVYRTPSGYNQEFIKHDLGVLLNNPAIKYSKDCDVKPLHPLTSEVRQKYNILPNTKDLSETPAEANLLCPPEYRTYFKQNFKKQFYVEQCPSLDPAGFDEEYAITIYEVKKTFPTMTMIQPVFRKFEKKVPRVKIELWTVQMILREIQSVLRKQSKVEQNSVIDANKNDEGGSNLKEKKTGEAQTLDDLLQKYVTNDDVGGGLPKMLDLFFSESQATSFNELANIELKRSYLEMYKGLEQWLNELTKVVEVFASVGRNTELTKLAEERLEDRTKILNERGALYKLQQLQENF